VIVNIIVYDKFGQSDNDTFLLGPGHLISGIVNREGTTQDSGISVILSKDTFYTFTALTTDTGYFVLRTLIFDTYLLSCSKSGYVSYSLNIAISGDTNLGFVYELQAGDFNGDGKINILDAAMIKKYYGQTKPEMDINNDNILGKEERDLYLQNFEK